MATDYANLIPANVARGLIDRAIEESAVLRLARVVRMPAGSMAFPVVSAVPVAAFVAAHGGRKPATVVEWSSGKITPEEIAGTLAIPQDWIDDASFPVWEEVEPLVAEAIGRTFDEAILWGTGAPASFPTGGVEAVAGTPVENNTPIDAVNAAMGVVEASGLTPTGHVAPPQIGTTLRSLKDAAGNLVYAQAVVEGEPDRLYGLPLTKTSAWSPGAGDADLLTGDWTKLVVGIRQDIRFDLSTEAVLQDGAGDIIANAFQDDLVAMRFYMRAGAAIGRPRNADGALTSPFALADFQVGAGGPMTEVEAEVARVRAAHMAEAEEHEAAREASGEVERVGAPTSEGKPKASKPAARRPTSSRRSGKRS